MAAEEFQELRRADDGVGDAGGLDQFLLGDLGAEIAIVGRPVGADDGERDMVPDAGCGLRREKVAAGGLEEFQHRPSSNEGELARSTTTCVPAMASLRPSPVMVLTPVLGEAATTSWPRWRRLATVFEPIRPVPPMTTIFMG
jgi:hypothetical protein